MYFVTFYYCFCTECLFGVLRDWCTNVVLVFLDSEFDHVLGLLQDVHGVLHCAVLQPHAVDGQQPVSGLQSACSTGHDSERITTINWGWGSCFSWLSTRILLAWCLSGILGGDRNLTLNLINTEPFWNVAALPYWSSFDSSIQLGLYYTVDSQNNFILFVNNPT